MEAMMDEAVMEAELRKARRKRSVRRKGRTCEAGAAEMRAYHASGARAYAEAAETRTNTGPTEAWPDAADTRGSAHGMHPATYASAHSMHPARPNAAAVAAAKATAVAAAKATAVAAAKATAHATATAAAKAAAPHAAAVAAAPHAAAKAAATTAAVAATAAAATTTTTTTVAAAKGERR
jgi:hypothetical protein